MNLSDFREDYQRGALNRAKHANMCKAAAENTRKRLLNLVIGSFRILVEESFRGHNHGVNAEAALRGLLFDERALKRMRLFERADAFERCNF